jgi:hypothetical protein
MTENEMVERMTALCHPDCDKELAHCEGDDLVSAALRQCGWGKLADAYYKARDNWWYA